MPEEPAKVLLFLVVSVGVLLACAFVPYSWLRQGPLPERLTNTLWFEIVLRGVLMVSVSVVAYGAIFVWSDQDRSPQTKVDFLILGCTAAWLLFCAFAPLSLEMMGDGRYGMPVPERLRQKPWFWVLIRGVFLVMLLWLTYWVVILGKSPYAPIF